ncbi:MAG TPA: hypothetical protein VK249_28205 [Anaerolineales bacterium]|nr:hypothetical protein [Anaerolineales bacterium]
MKKKNYIAEYVVAAGYIIFFCLASVFCLSFYYLTRSEKPPSAVNVFATNLPATTPVPHITSIEKLGSSKVFEDNFSNNKNKWTIDQEGVQEKVSGGKLLFESRTEHEYALVECSSCPYLKEPYYLQADFATTAATAEGFGLVFNKSHIDYSFYLFQINTETKTYYLFHRGKEDWSLCTAGESAQIKSFPATNTLGVYINLDTVELYINGRIVDSYQQSGYSFQSGYLGLLASDSGFKLAVDNLSLHTTAGQ